MSNKYRYKIFCNTENKYIEDLEWNTIQITQCPNDNNHNVDIQSVTAIESIPISLYNTGNNSEILIKDDSVENGVKWERLFHIWNIYDIKNIGSNGGAFINNVWITRTLNTIYKSHDSLLVTLNNNQLTISPGFYMITCSAPASNIIAHKIRLYNITDNITVSLGTSGSMKDSRSFINTYINISTTTVFEIQHLCNNSNGNGNGNGNDGLGKSTGILEEKYTECTIVKLIK